MKKDAIDIISKTVSTGSLNIEECLCRPQIYTNSRGRDLFGYSPENFSKAALYYSDHCNKLQFDRAEVILDQMKVTIALEELKLLFKKAIFGNINKVEFLQKKNMEEIILALYCHFSGQSEEEIKDLISKGLEIYTDIWSDIVSDEDNITIEQLVKFYNNIPFPIGCFLRDCAMDNLAMAYSALPILLAKTYKRKRIFDFGGNSGMLTSAISNSVDVEFCMLIEENNTLIEFAKWRDDLFGIKNVLYVKESIISESIHEFSGKFDMGICTEVLEHVYDVEETVSNISQLLAKGGLLYQSTSFELYPEPSHLKKNIKFAGHEDELMARYGLERIDVQFPIPTLITLKVYIKK